MNKFNFLKIENIEEGITLVSINREDKLNALNKEVLENLSEFFTTLDSKLIKVVILTGVGEKSFIAGADIAGMSEMNVSEGCEFSNLGQEVSLLIENCPVPVIAAVGGYALGGGLEMALSCDFILATQNAIFGLPEVSLGLIPGFGGTQRLSKIIGRNKAKELIYTAGKIDASEAYRLGLVVKVVDNKQLLIDDCVKIAGKILRNSPNAISCAKKVINEGADLNIKEGLGKEKEVFSNIFDSFDMKEGTSAFTQKRKPQFRGE